jgi:hypothetical protein
MKYLILLILLPLWQFMPKQKIRLGDGTYSSKCFTIDGVKSKIGNGTYSSNKVLYTDDK